MRKCTITIIIIILILLAIPAITGQYLKYLIQNKIAKNKWPNYTVKLISYDAGWFHSKARFIISSNKLTSQTSKLQPQITMNLRIFHGPLTYVKDLAGHRYWFFGEGVLEGTANVSDFPLRIFARQYFNNDIDLVLQNSGYQYHNPDKRITVVLNNLHSHIVIEQNLRKISGETVLEKATLFTPVIEMTMPKMVSHFKLERDASGLWIGQRDNLIPLISMKAGQTTVGSIADMNFNSQTQVANNLMQGALKGHVRQIIVPSLQPLGPLNLDYKMSNVEIGKIMVLNQFLANANLAEDNPNKEQVDRQLLMHLAGVLQGTIQDLSDLSLNTAQGVIKLSIYAQFSKEAINVNQVADKTIIQEVFAKLWQRAKATVKIRIPSKLVLAFLQNKNQNLMMQLNLLQNAGAIKTDGDYLTTEIISDHGAIFLNGLSLQNISANYQSELLKSQQQNPMQVQPNGQPQGSTPSAINQEGQPQSLPLLILQMLQKQRQATPPSVQE